MCELYVHQVDSEGGPATEIDSLMTFMTRNAKARLILTLYATILVASPIVHGLRGLPSNDFGTYYAAGLRARTGLPLYLEDDPRNRLTAPALVALAFAPFSLVSLEKAYWIWFVINVTALFGCFYLSLKIARRMFKAADLGVALITFLLLSRFILNHLQRGQVNLPVFFLVLLALHWFESGKRTISGVFLGLATAIKIFPVFFLCYWIRKREWLSASVMTLSLVVFSLLPACWFGIGAYGACSTLWLRQVGVRAALGNLPVDFFSPHPPYNLQNQSLFAAVIRLFSKGDATGNHGVNVFALENPGLQILVLSVVVLFIAYTLVRGAQVDSEIRVVEYALICILMLLCIPLVWKANFVLLIFPYVVLLAAVKANVWAKGIFVTLAAATTLHYAPKLLPQGLNDVCYACSVLTASGLLIWSGALRLHFRCRSVTAHGEREAAEQPLSGLSLP